MRYELKKSPAYTLMELVIVVIIIGLTASFAIPAFKEYGQKQAFGQKVDEAEMLMQQVYTLSRNPEKDVLLYEINIDQTSNKFILKRCFAIVASRCSVQATDFQIVKEVPLLKSQAFQISDSNLPESFLACPANTTESCISEPVNKFSFTDSNLAKQGVVVFSINSPFSITKEIKDP